MPRPELIRRLDPRARPMTCARMDGEYAMNAPITMANSPSSSARGRNTRLELDASVRLCREPPAAPPVPDRGLPGAPPFERPENALPLEPRADDPEDGLASEPDPLPDPPFPETVGTTPETGLDAVDGVGDLDPVPDEAGGDEEDVEDEAAIGQPD